MKTDFWSLPDDAKVRAYRKIAEQVGLSPNAVEKDWWVSIVIKSVFNLRCADFLTFKGGTSLNKAWNLTGRFSEDVDIAFDKSFFGLEGRTRSQKDRIRKLARVYIHDEVLPELDVTLAVFGAWESDLFCRNRKDSDADPTVLMIPYRSLLPPDPYIKPEVKLEFSCRSPLGPREQVALHPIICEYAPGIQVEEMKVATVVPTRTFLEKVFLLHEEYQKDYPRVNRMTRHLYDLDKLMDTKYGREALESPELYVSLVKHRAEFNAMRGIDYHGHHPSRLVIAPPERLCEDWRHDYEKMQNTFIYGESPDFETLMGRMHELECRFHNMNIDDPFFVK